MQGLKIEKNYHFYAAHRNKAGGTKCGRIHGHTYDIRCYFSFTEKNEGGITCLFSDIDQRVNPIIKSYCHWLLLYENDPLVNVLRSAGEEFKLLPFETSAENLSEWIFDEIKRTGLPIVKIELRETKSSNVIYGIKN